jgi:hypothetical protein
VGKDSQPQVVAPTQTSSKHSLIVFMHKTTYFSADEDSCFHLPVAVCADIRGWNTMDRRLQHGSLMVRAFSSLPSQERREVDDSTKPLTDISLSHFHLKIVSRRYLHDYYVEFANEPAVQIPLSQFGNRGPIGRPPKLVSIVEGV